MSRRPEINNPSKKRLLKKHPSFICQELFEGPNDYNVVPSSSTKSQLNNSSNSNNNNNNNNNNNSNNNNNNNNSKSNDINCNIISNKNDSSNKDNNVVSGDDDHKYRYYDDDHNSHIKFLIERDFKPNQIKRIDYSLLRSNVKYYAPYDVPGYGDCLFHSLVISLEYLKSNNIISDKSTIIQLTEELKAEAATYLSDNRSNYNDFEMKDETGEIIFDEDKQEYMKEYGEPYSMIDSVLTRLQLVKGKRTKRIDDPDNAEFIVQVIGDLKDCRVHILMLSDDQTEVSLTTDYLTEKQKLLEDPTYTPKREILVLLQNQAFADSNAHYYPLIPIPDKQLSLKFKIVI